MGLSSHSAVGAAVRNCVTRPRRGGCWFRRSPSRCRRRRSRPRACPLASAPGRSGTPATPCSAGAGSPWRSTRWTVRAPAPAGRAGLREPPVMMTASKSASDCGVRTVSPSAAASSGCDVGRGAEFHALGFHLRDAGGRSATSSFAGECRSAAGRRCDQFS